MAKAIIIEDEHELRELLTLHMETLGFEIEAFADGNEAYSRARQGDFAFMLLDLNLPGKNGLEICRDLRAEDVDLPILMLTARGEEADLVRGLETGADDYLSKPFRVNELIARVKALLRRSQQRQRAETEQTGSLSFDELEIDRRMRKVMMNGRRIDLTPKEYDLLVLLAANPGVTFDRSELLDKVWSYDFDGYEHTVNSHINRLRAKIEEDAAKPKFILTTWGVGYRFREEDG